MEDRNLIEENFNKLDDVGKMFFLVLISGILNPELLKKFEEETKNNIK
jgi:hypothetical protein